MAWAAKQEATGGSTARGLRRRDSRIERAASIPIDCSADKTSGGRHVCSWRGLPAKRDSFGRHFSHAPRSKRLDPMDARGVNFTSWNGD